jgi:hypothetical protein
MVYIVQEVPGRNVLPARQYGELRLLLPDGDIVLSAGPTTRKLQRALKDFCEQDYLLLMGDPVAIGLTCAIASDINQGRFKMLKWDRQQHCYFPVEVVLHRKVSNE